MLISTLEPKFPEGMLFFLSAPSAERKKKLSALCGSAVKTTDPYRVNIKPLVFQVEVDPQ